ncbi:S-adenosylmethionine:tRNA ribosyltransferase-isomerase [Campylobacter blaseri]|uniref:S-adenosylmethionine:tRNA ribosyltransferase-isomerase n=1 Tax=Campylobacter blaseri TaxID=2042961 RepID=A0A2P8R212_9BACT|nr:tRNA preQ1(34) S-adenosylmethionine ribosyltransferase-isomerase QueA [Campylobacter blaseri]PSM52539.1 tRNA preQ1(34) S-adenosylmethionine ribosyltransferase-isomerase QueA [Campylobacter blaseri]PSM54187.1 tRNA preQ1(34) S-adenosylmethionine ribosyltransferase-isomerase QueA [Campylobacter blaseri]QKF85838.1 S-adenosylmethionine:tRNA ribosyltransferase-isomerase [Campylobacter blaseri]
MNDLDLISSYDYELPKELISSKPTLPKENARLLVYDRKKDLISHYKFGDLVEILPPCDIIFNDTKVVKARVYGVKDTGGKVELLLNTPLEDSKFNVYIKGHVKIGTILNFNKNLKAKVIEINSDGTRIVSFSFKNSPLSTDEIFNFFNNIGHIPLPPYIKRDDNNDDEIWYQSIFAKHLGAVAAPTASLHFSDEMANELKKTHELHYLTLHVGAGTFKAIKCENIHEHNMHSEYFNIPSKTAEILKTNKPILGVGTTVTRVVEEFARNGKQNGYCKLFLNHSNRPIRLNYLLTNFHLPKSTLIMLVSSFLGLEKTMEIYEIAIKERYKFYSYGDGMLIL